MKLEVFNPTVEIFVHSPYEIITRDSLFLSMGSTDDIENTYDVLETL